MKIYFDQNAWHKIFESYTAREFKTKIQSKNIRINLSCETIYEFGRIFLDDKKQEKVRRIFSYLWELTEATSYLKEIRELIISDLDYAINSGKLLPFLNKSMEISIKKEIYKISQGNYITGKNFIAKMEKNIEKDSPKFCETLKSINPKPPKNLKFEEFRDNWQMRRAILNNRYRNKAKYSSDEKLFSNPVKYPYVNTWINALLYMNFTAYSKSAKPKNYTSDLRHLIFANTADNFITNDYRLMKISKKVCPFITVLHWDKFQKMIS